MAETMHIIAEGAATAVDANVSSGRVLLAPDAIERALGWSLKPEGFCREDVCVPVKENSGVLTGSSVDLEAFANLLGKPLALDLNERAASLAASARDRGAALRTLEAPDFALPDIDGRVHSLSDHRGKKVFLAVWASW